LSERNGARERQASRKNEMTDFHYCS